MAKESLLHGALYDKHIAAGATMGEEAGWQAPLSYAGSLEEVATIRRRAGVLDISHVGRLRIRGDSALELLEKLCTHDVARQEDNTARPTLLCNDRGGIIDQGVLVRGEDFWLLTTSPGNRQKVLRHLMEQGEGLAVKIDDQTEKTAHLAVIGPQAPKLLDACLPIKPSPLPRGAVVVGSLMIARYIAMRIGYAGLWSLEVIIPNLVAGQAWRFITEKAGDNRIRPAGMGARDILRIESGLPRYGHEINETIDPVTAGLMEMVDMAHGFIGRDAIRVALQRPPARKLVGLALTPKGKPAAGLVPRQGSAVFAADGPEIGTVTSGTFSPTLDQPIALGYVSAGAKVGQEVRIDATGQNLAATIVSIPFQEG